MEADLEYFTGVVRACFNYVNECSQPPKTLEKPRGATSKTNDSVPFPLMMVTVLTSKVGLDIDKAWETPIGQAVWLLTAFAIQEGADTKIVTTESDEKSESEREALAKMQAEALAKIKQEAASRKKR